MGHHTLLRLDRLPHLQPSHLHSDTKRTRTQERCETPWKQNPQRTTPCTPKGRILTATEQARSYKRCQRTARELAEKHGISVRTVQSFYAEQRESYEGRAQETRERIIELKRQGLKQVAIA